MNNEPRPNASCWRPETLRERAVRQVDAKHGYTYEFSSSPEAHLQEYDDREAELRGGER
jgi:hypothetical protein